MLRYVCVIVKVFHFFKLFFLFLLLFWNNNDLVVDYYNYWKSYDTEFSLIHNNYRVLNMCLLTLNRSIKTNNLILMRNTIKKGSFII